MYPDLFNVSNELHICEQYNSYENHKNSSIACWQSEECGVTFPSKIGMLIQKFM